MKFFNKGRKYSKKIHENLDVFEFIPLSLKFYIKEEFEIHKSQKTNPTDPLNDQTFVQANIVKNSLKTTKFILVNIYSRE